MRCTHCWGRVAYEHSQRAYVHVNDGTLSNPYCQREKSDRFAGWCTGCSGCSECKVL